MLSVRPLGAWAISGALVALVATGCGAARQDAHESKGTYSIKVLEANFPAQQSIAKPAQLRLELENAGSHTAPNVAVTLDSFYYASSYPELAERKRPIWVVEQGPGAIASAPVESQAVSPPGNGQTVYVNTWALGGLAAGQTRTFVWRVVPVKAGTYSVHYAVAAGLAGKAKAALPSGGPVQGDLTADIAPAPAARHVDPYTGKVVPGRFPPVP